MSPLYDSHGRGHWHPDLFGPTRHLAASPIIPDHCHTTLSSTRHLAASSIIPDHCHTTLRGELRRPFGGLSHARPESFMRKL